MLYCIGAGLVQTHLFAIPFLFVVVVFFVADKKLQLTYSGLPGVDGCLQGNPKVVFYFECGNHVGQPQFKA